MPILNEIKRGYEIGKYGRHKYIWVACRDCGKERWVDFYRSDKWCKHCSASGIRSSQWKGGISHTLDGYTLIKLQLGDFFYSMTKGNGGYVLEHRFIMAKYLGRCLQSWEYVHHKNGKRNDNRLGNLDLVLKGVHNGKVKCPFCHEEFNIQ